MLVFLDLILFSLHLAVIGFNLFGWIKPNWRRAHLIVAGLTIFSWLVLGIWYGFGYCFLTDWEWSLKRELGETGLPNSFIAYLANNIFRLGLSAQTVDHTTVWAFIPPVLISLWLNFKKKRG